MRAERSTNRVASRQQWNRAFPIMFGVWTKSSLCSNRSVADFRTRATRNAEIVAAPAQDTSSFKIPRKSRPKKAAKAAKIAASKECCEARPVEQSLGFFLPDEG